ncbi:MAG: Glutamate synthase large chain, partial [Myxococcaceae bacterium]|nr:Glutamate synthase large chain [Myxococcaceae bacterium]
SGGIISVKPPADVTFVAADSVIVGNTVMYGATSGRAFFAGRAGERFAVRNSGAMAVVEGTGDHACEYMTGGVVIVLGPTGRNFGAGMSGGLAFVYDEDGAFVSRCNMGMVGVEPLDADDEARIQALVEEHVARTASVRGADVLARWNDVRARFKKVIPTEYKRVLEQQRTAAAAAAEGQPRTATAAADSQRRLKLVKGG